MQRQRRLRRLLELLRMAVPLVIHRRMHSCPLSRRQCACPHPQQLQLLLMLQLTQRRLTAAVKLRADRRVKRPVGSPRETCVTASRTDLSCEISPL